MDRGRCERWQRLSRARQSRRGLTQTIGCLSLAFAARTPLAALAQEGTPCPETATDDAIAIAEAYFVAFDDGDADALGALLAPDYRHHGAVVNDQDRDLHRERLRINRAAFPDGHTSSAPHAENRLPASA